MTKRNSNISVIMVGADLTSNGGIASVVKNYYHAYSYNQSAVDLTLLKTGYYKDKPLFYEVIIFLKALFKYIFLLSTHKVHIVHCHSSGGISFYRSSFFVFIGKVFRKKVLIHLHASNFYDYFLEGSRMKIKLLHSILRLADLIIVLCSDWEKKLAEKYRLENLLVLPNPVNSEAIRLNTTSEKKELDPKLKVIFLGFLIRSKGIFDIIKLVGKFKEKNITNIEFVIGGKGEEEREFLRKIKESELENYIEFLGWVSNGKYELLQNSDVFFLPSYKEGMPIAILESMACGLPIISTDIAGIPDLVKNDYNGYLFAPGDIEGFFKALLSILNNKSKLEELGQNSLKLAQNFDSKLIFKNLCQVYKSLI